MPNWLQREKNMRVSWCDTLLSSVLKFLSFLQASVGVAMIVYSAYMVNHWHHNHNQIPPTGEIEVGIQASAIYLASGVVSSHDDSLGLNLDGLPAPWFIYGFMGIGILILCISLIGYIGAEAVNDCCLCFYATLAAIFLVLEAGLVAFIALDHQWEKDIPFDPTGELGSLQKFIEDNRDIFQWVGIAFVITHFLTLLLAIVLRTLISRHRVNDDVEGDYGFRSSTGEPLLIPYSHQVSGSIRGDSDIWSSRMREKYGLHASDGRHNVLQSASTDVKQ